MRYADEVLLCSLVKMRWEPGRWRIRCIWSFRMVHMYDKEKQYRDHVEIKLIYREGKKRCKEGQKTAHFFLDRLDQFPSSRFSWIC